MRRPALGFAFALWCHPQKSKNATTKPRAERGTHPPHFIFAPTPHARLREMPQGYGIALGYKTGFGFAVDCSPSPFRRGGEPICMPPERNTAIGTACDG